MKKTPILKTLDNAVSNIVKDAAAKNPSVFSKQVNGGVRLGNVVARKGKVGIDIYKMGEVLYSDIKDADVAQAIVNRLVTNSKIKDIPAILKLEDELVRNQVDMMFFKHSYKTKKDENDKEILEHRMILVSQRIEETKNKIYSYKNI